MGKKDKNKKKGKGAEKTLVKTDKKLVAKNKKLLQKLGEVKVRLKSTSLESYKFPFYSNRRTFKTWSQNKKRS